MGLRVFELGSDGRLTRDIINEIGKELTFAERLANGVRGLGHLRYKSGDPILNEFYDRHDHTIKTHFDWTSSGAVIRIRTTNKLYAIGLRRDGFRSIKLVRLPDHIYAIPFTPFWILIRLGVRIEIAEWVELTMLERRGRGLCKVFIDHTDAELTFELAGDLWKDCLKTFQIKSYHSKLLVEDQRSLSTLNGVRIKNVR